MAKVKNKPGTRTASEGAVSQVIGAVVDVEFPPGQLPSILHAVVVHPQDGRSVVMEVEQEIGDNSVRCIAMDTTDGFRRGDRVTATGSPIMVPVGVETLGRMFNVVGEAIDDEPTPRRVQRRVVGGLADVAETEGLLAETV